MATPRFNTLESLVATWARDAELPDRMVLRNFCDWIVVGSIPEDAIVGPDGDRIAPLEIYRARRVLFPTRSEEGRTFRADPTRWVSLLQSVLITDAGVHTFCAATRTELPVHLRPRPRWPWNRIEPAENRAPPPCPQAQKHVERLEAHQSALGLLSQLRSLLDKLVGRPSRYRLYYQAGEPIDFERLDETWSRYSSSAEASIRVAGDEELVETLALLRHEWEQFRSAAVRVQGGMLNPYADEENGASRPTDTPTVAMEAHGPATGTYVQAALEKWYLGWVANLVEEGRIPTTDEEWETAKSVCGSGVPRSAIRQLRTDHAPDSWRRPGRRSRSDPDGG